MDDRRKQDERLDEIIKRLSILSTDMLYVKKHIDNTADQSIRLALVETKVSGLNKIAWKIGTLCGGAIITALLALII